jgi:thioredoxin-like negative regulator of GroEL
MPDFEKTAQDHPDVTFYKIDVDKALEVAEELGVDFIPTAYLFQDGKEFSVVRPATAAAVKSEVDQLDAQSSGESA